MDYKIKMVTKAEGPSEVLVSSETADEHAHSMASDPYTIEEFGVLTIDVVEPDGTTRRYYPPQPTS